jgi:hypothetical protein
VASEARAYGEDFAPNLGRGLNFPKRLEKCADLGRQSELPCKLVQQGVSIMGF